MVDKEIQIKTLLYGSALKLARETLGVTSMLGSDYAKVFTVTAEEVHEYVAKHGLRENGFEGERPPRDDYYYYQTDSGGWHAFAQERGRRHDEEIFADYEVGKAAIVQSIIRNAGTGLYR